MASGRCKKSLNSESNRSLFEFFTRNESNPSKILRSILSDVFSASAAKAENTRSDQQHHASADDKTLEKWKLNHLWLIVVCVEVLRPSQPNGVMSSAVSLPNHTFTGQT